MTDQTQSYSEDEEMREAYQKLYQRAWVEGVNPLNPTYSVQFCWQYCWPLAIATKKAELFTRPPITSQREIELLAVIDQKDKAMLAAQARIASFVLLEEAVRADKIGCIHQAIKAVHQNGWAECEYVSVTSQLKRLDGIRDDLSALKEHDDSLIRKIAVRVVMELEGLASEYVMNQVYQTTTDMASELRQPTGTPIDISKLELNTTYHIWEKDGRMFAQAEGYEVVDITPQDWSKMGKS